MRLMMVFFYEVDKGNILQDTFHWKLSMFLSTKVKHMNTKIHLVSN